MALYVRRVIGLVIVLMVVALVVPLLSVALLATAQDDQPVQVIFMHHSTGLGVIEQGGVREGLTTLGYEFWDHGYNEEGLVDSAGNTLNVNWDVPDDNTDPDGWYAIFNQPVTNPPDNTLSHMLQFDVIVFKSCFPTSDIVDDAMLEQYKEYYLSIRDVMDHYPNKVFIPFTPPPLVPNETTPENAMRAQQWAAFLTSDEYLDGHPNVFVFDFFSQLADENGNLRADYRADEFDSHPNEIANATIGPLLVEFIDQARRDFVANQLAAEAMATEEALAELYATGSAIRLVFGGFEDTTILAGWWNYTNDPVNAFACTVSPTAHSGSSALEISLDILAEGGAGCGVNFAADTSFADARGISFYWRTDAPELVMRLGVAVYDPSQPASDPGEATSFEVELWIDSEDWTPVTVLWEDLMKPAWVGDTGLDAFDPTRIAWMVFNVGYWNSAQAGSIWIDDVALIE